VRPSGLCFFYRTRKSAPLPISIRDCKRSSKDRRWIEEVYGEYVESLSNLNTGYFLGLSPDNTQQEEIFANWFANDHAHPLLIVQGQRRGRLRAGHPAEDSRRPPRRPRR
jgi:hypothetical protein